MTDPERDATVSQRYRELPAEEPPRALDEAILAASRRAAHTRPAPPQLNPWAPAGRRRWYVPLAAAAVIVLAVGLTLRVQLEQPDPESIAQRPASAPAPTAEQPRQPEAKPEEKLVAKAEPRSRVQRQSPDRLAEAPAPFQTDKSAREAPAAPTAQADARAAESQVMMRGGPAATAPAPQAAPRSDDAARDRAERSLAIGAATAKRMQEAEETPAKTLERIAELRKAGKHDEADKALAEFRKRHPEYKLSDEMRTKVERRP